MLIERTAAVRRPAEEPAFVEWSSHAPQALLLSRAPETLAWGKKWLERFGFKVSVASSLDEAPGVLANGLSEIVIVDSAIAHPGDDTAWSAVRRTTGAAEVPLLVICSSDAEARTAVAQGGTDVIRKPIEWLVLSQRAVRLVQAHRGAHELLLTRSELENVQNRCKTQHPGDPNAPLDVLTGLPQRRSFEHTLESALAVGHRTGSAQALLFLDLDRFKLINGTYGRLGGSQVLVQVAERLRSCLHKGTIAGGRRVGVVTAAIARVGGDAFALMVSPAGSRDEIAPMAQGVLDSLSMPFLVDAEEVYVSASIGIALAPHDGATAEELLQCAELAMAESGRRGGATFCFYSRSLTDARERALKLDRLLRRAFERGELCLYYQPIVDMGSRKIVGAEALLRWNSPELGEVPPAEFIPVAEETGFMVDIGRWVLQEACRQLREWQDAGLPPLRMATNVSMCELTRGNLPQVVEEALRAAGVEASQLELELSERGILRSDPEVLRQLHAVREMGVRISVDDFGTGDSAIAYLKRFPLDTLKVDQSYVAGAVHNEDDAAITSAMIAMAHRLRLRVVAEGVEGQHQVDLLQRMDCEEVQGFFFSPPVPPAAFRALMGGN
jgi:diguanylate cyclase (GGDEF)-like protein